MNNPGVVLTVERVTKQLGPASCLLFVTLICGVSNSRDRLSRCTDALDPFHIAEFMSNLINLTPRLILSLLSPSRSFEPAHFEPCLLDLSWWYSLTHLAITPGRMVLTSRESAGDIHRREDGGRHWRCTPGIPSYCAGLFEGSSPELQDMLWGSIPLAGVWRWLSYQCRMWPESWWSFTAGTKGNYGSSCRAPRLQRRTNTCSLWELRHKWQDVDTGVREGSAASDSVLVSLLESDSS